MKLNLVLLTSNFPYGSDDEFLTEEIEVLSKHFEQIFIMSFSKEKDVKRKLPDNVKYVNARYSGKSSAQYMKVALSMISITTIGEVIFAKRELKVGRFKEVISKILIYNRKRFYFERVIKNYQEFHTNTVYYSFWLSGLAYSLLELKKQRYAGAIVSRAHGGDLYLERGYLPFRREIVEGMDVIHSASEKGREYLLKTICPHVNCDKQKIRVSYLGFTKAYNLMNPSMIEEKVLRIISCSNIINVKRLDIIVDALHITDEIDVQWTHIGSGALEGKIKRYAESKLGEKKNIDFLFKGRMKNADIQKLYTEEHFDLFVNVSDSEGLPVSIMEAMAYGIPALARNIGGNNEIIKNDENGFLVSGINIPEQVAKKMNQYFEMGCIERKYLSQKAYQCYKEKFYGPKNYEKFAFELKNLI